MTQGRNEARGEHPIRFVGAHTQLYNGPHDPNNDSLCSNHTFWNHFVVGLIISTRNSGSNDIISFWKPYNLLYEANLDTLPNPPIHVLSTILFICKSPTKHANHICVFLGYFPQFQFMQWFDSIPTINEWTVFLSSKSATRPFPYSFLSLFAFAPPCLRCFRGVHPVIGEIPSDESDWRTHFLCVEGK